MLSPESIVAVHDKGTVQLELSFHQKWIASAGSDGGLLLRLVENQEKAVICKPHNYRRNGCTALVFSRDSQHIVTVGDQSTINCWNWEFTNHGSVKAQAAGDYLERVLHSLGSQHDQENTALEAMPPVSEEPTEEQSTWLEAVEEKVHKAEDEKYADCKSELRREIGQLRGRLLEMIDSNEGAPDLERLDREEFILDMEQHDRLQAEEDQQIQQVKEEIQLSSLAKMFLRQQIKSECWDSMAVKGKIIKAFRGSLEVSNYPMMSRSENEVRELARVKTLRTVEQADREARNEAVDILRKAAQAKDEVEEEEEEGGDEGAAKEEGEEGDAGALYGSHGPKFGGGCEFLYSQFELHSPVARKHQITLLKDCMHRIAETFNKEFEEVARLKQAEIARIREKNVRISKIIQQLQLTEQLVQPTLQSEEQPEGMLTVQDEEVRVEKYLSPEERQKEEEAMRLEEERKLAEMGDNPRERALDMMMGGRLEANVEEDLFKDLPRPDFMQKDPAERTEEEIRAALEFEKKEAEFLEEREKLRKALEGELRKLQSTIAQAMDNFDERLRKLFDLKINTEMALHQEPLKVVGLVSSLQVEEEIAGRERQLNALLEDKKTLKTQLSVVIKSARTKTDECRELYDQMLADDKTLDRNFKRDFADCELFVDQLYKLFKRRPRGQKLKPGASEGGLMSVQKSQNPFSQRPPTAAGDGQRLSVKGSEDGMSELDHPSHMPEGVDAVQWDRLVLARRRKYDSETKV
ncbi:Cilia- and flagella-associated protein 43 [Geodia barretti]|uniref:Cilia- and flagella-associated protein 43 n=1 Tax=Geodia barretti TaxID=519541 RepID=A0AA35SVQ3_GEOBA|nr:Cilia- and flagella-associated protein 43 [Geodia barretti]